MRRDTEVRVFLMGTECELRPLSAALALDAKAESRRLIGEFGADSRDTVTIENACRLAKGLYADGQRVFTSGMEALLSLTEPEIAFAVSGFEEAEKVILPPAPESEENELSAKRALFAEGVSESVYAEDKTLPGADTPEDAVLPLEDREEEGYSEERRGARWEENPAEALRRSADFRGISVGGRASGHDGFSAEPSSEVYTPPERYRERLERMSDFFERDSRRYDGGFGTI